MKYSLIGQSEVLTASGVYLFSSGETTIGIACGALGLVGAICRYSINAASSQEEEESPDGYEQLSKALSKIYEAQK